VDQAKRQVDRYAESHLWPCLTLFPEVQSESINKATTFVARVFQFSRNVKALMRSINDLIR
jgi:hypothetical protein